MGSITSDRETAVSGLTGRQASLIPVQIRVGQNTYRMQLVQDRVMTPLLMQMALFSAIDSTERSVGAPDVFGARPARFRRRLRCASTMFIAAMLASR